MPIYEFGCDKCGCEFEELVFSDKEKPVCPQCGAASVSKLMSACARRGKGDSGGDFSMPSGGGGGCSGCSGGHCASCGH